MMQPQECFGDFNPLDVLATAAASLQNAKVDSVDCGSQPAVLLDSPKQQSRDACVATDDAPSSPSSGGLKGEEGAASVTGAHKINGDFHKVTLKSCLELRSCAQDALSKKDSRIHKPIEIKVETSKSKPLLTLRDATKIVVPSKQLGKTLTVLKINKQQMSDHSYAFVCQLERLPQVPTTDSLTRDQSGGPECDKNRQSTDVDSQSQGNSGNPACVSKKSNGINTPTVTKVAKKAVVIRTDVCAEKPCDSNKTLTCVKNTVLRSLLGSGTANTKQHEQLGQAFFRLVKANAGSDADITCDEPEKGDGCVSQHVEESVLTCEVNDDTDGDNTRDISDCCKMDTMHDGAICTGEGDSCLVVDNENQGDPSDTFDTRTAITEDKNTGVAPNVSETGSENDPSVVLCSGGETTDGPQVCDSVANIDNNESLPRPLEPHDSPAETQTNVDNSINVSLPDSVANPALPGGNIEKQADSCAQSQAREVEVQAPEHEFVSTGKAEPAAVLDESCTCDNRANTNSSQSEPGNTGLNDIAEQDHRPVIQTQPTEHVTGKAMSPNSSSKCGFSDEKETSGDDIIDKADGIVSPGRGYLVTTADGKPQRAHPAQKNQYVIEDDVPPTAKYAQTGESVDVTPGDTAKHNGAASQPPGGDTDSTREDTVSEDSPSVSIGESEHKNTASLGETGTKTESKGTVHIIPVSGKVGSVMQLLPASAGSKMQILKPVVGMHGSKSGQLNNQGSGWKLLSSEGKVILSNPTQPAKLGVSETGSCIKAVVRVTDQKTGLQSLVLPGRVSGSGPSTVIQLMAGCNLTKRTESIEPKHAVDTESLLEDKNQVKGDGDHKMCKDSVDEVTSSCSGFAKSISPLPETETDSHCSLASLPPISEAKDQSRSNTPTDKINVKIASCRILDISPETVDAGSTGHISPAVVASKKGEYAKTSIGTLGSLSWGSIADETPSSTPGNFSHLSPKSLPGITNCPPLDAVKVEPIVCVSKDKPLGSFSHGRWEASSPFEAHETLRREDRVSSGEENTAELEHRYSLTTKGETNADVKTPVQKLVPTKKVGVVTDGKKSHSDQEKVLDGVSARTGHAACGKKKRKGPTGPTLEPEVDIKSIQRNSQTVTELHPLVDHDYCMFREFNAEIQSSIIATTETKARIVKKYTKKAKAARTKAVRSIGLSEKISRVKEGGKQGRRKGSLSEVKLEDETDSTESLQGLDNNSCKGGVTVKIEPEEEGYSGAERKSTERQISQEKKYEKKNKSPAKDKSNKNFVKITGSYQDDFVYFATKKYSRKRKLAESADSSQLVPGKLPSVGGMSVFDWYRDLSKSDKSSRFGIPGHSEESSLDSESSLRGTYKDDMQVAAFATSVGDHASQLDRTPIHESEVVDLVCELSGINTDMSMSEAHQTNSDGSQDVEHLNIMAEQVRHMLNSMGEAELSLLDKNVAAMTAKMCPVESGEDSENTNDSVASSSNVKTEAVRPAEDTGLGSMLTSYQPESCGPMASHLFDLDDINDSDLLTTELANMNQYLSSIPSSGTGDAHVKSGLLRINSFEEDGSIKTNNTNLNMLLCDSTESPVKNCMESCSLDTKVDISQAGLSGLNLGKAMEFSDSRLDKTELFPDMSTPETPTVSDISAPELTIVSMYWNDLPGLLISGKEYVRLVDIHKQMLPAKDTGILKKRCQMLGLEVTNCTELQRDFLIRYANAAKSKSTVIVPQNAAKALVSFYVDPRPKACRQMSEDPGDGETRDTKGAGIAGSEPETRKSTVGDNYQETEAQPRRGSSEPRESTGGKKQKIRLKVEDSKTAKDPVTREEQVMVDADSSAGSEDGAAKQSPAPSPRLRSNLSTTESNLIVKRSARLKNRKVEYAKIHNGERDAIQASGESKEKAANGDSNSSKEKAEGGEEENTALDNQENIQEDMKPIKKVSKLKHNGKVPLPEMLEIQGLIQKAKRKNLSKRDRKRLKKLKEKVKQIERKLKLHNRKRQERFRKDRLKMTISKTRQKLQETHTYTKHHNQEHCYAVCPSDYQSEMEKNQVSVEKRCPSTPSAQREDVPVIDPPVDKKPAPLEVIHRGNGQRGHSQEGGMHLNLFLTKNSPCIQCATCSDFYSIKAFVRHFHLSNSPDELYEGPLPQKLELCSPNPTDSEKTSWDEFERRLQQFDKVVPEKETAKTKANNDPSSAQAQPAANCEPVVKENCTPSSGIALGNTRHSTRVRKRKQLHPIERYVYSKSLPHREPELKKTKLENPDLVDSSNKEVQQKVFSGGGSPEVESASVSPVRRMKLNFSCKKDTGDEGLICKYDLRVPSPEGTGDGQKRKVVTRRNKDIDLKLTALEQDT